MISTRKVIVKTLQKTKLNRITHKAYYRYLHGFSTANRSVLPTLETCLEKAHALGTTERGDYYEFGIFKGYAFWFAQKVATRYGLQGMRFFGFDSFAGLPAVEGPDLTANDDFYAGQFACTKERVIESLNANGVDWDRTFLIEGYFDQSLTEQTRRDHDMQRIAVALIDCDLYRSTQQVLEFITDMVIDGTILIFDDWNCFDRDDGRGQRKAFRAWLEDNPQFRADDMFAYGHYGQVFMLRNAAAPEVGREAAA